jgi:hypothetical protein
VQSRPESTIPAQASGLRLSPPKSLGWQFSTAGKLFGKIGEHGELETEPLKRT